MIFPIKSFPVEWKIVNHLVTKANSIRSRDEKKNKSTQHSIIKQNKNIYISINISLHFVFASFYYSYFFCRFICRCSRKIIDKNKKPKQIAMHVICNTSTTTKSINLISFISHFHHIRFIALFVIYCVHVHVLR